MALDDDDAAFGHVVELAVALGVVANRRVLRHADVFVENGPSDFSAAADVAVIEDHRVLHIRSGVDAHAAADDRSANETAGEDGTAGDDRVEGVAAAALGV